MRLLRHISTRQLVYLCAAVVALIAGATVVAVAATGGGPKPPPKPLAAAIHDALAAKPVQGVSARIDFTNHLVDSSSIQGSDPILTGASGRLWASADGRVRLELQADAASGGGGDVQVLVDNRDVTVYDSSANSVYTGQLPAQHSGQGSDQVPSMSQIEREISRVAERAVISDATPSDVAGRPAYTVRVSPRHDGGLLGGAELAWDSTHGTPLRAAIYSSGSSSPVLELKATDISFGSIDPSVFDITPPASAQVTNLNPPNHKAGAENAAPVTGVDAVAGQLPFKLTAPEQLAGLPRGEVRLISTDRNNAALVTYGRGLGGIAVLETSAQDKADSPSSSADGGGLNLPKVSINGITGEELDTALGSVVRFQRGGIAYTVAGSVPAAAAEAAAAGL